MIYTDEPLSPGWWLKRLMGQLIERRPRYDLLQSYYDGTNGIPAYADAAVRDAARRLMAMSGTNYAELAIEATRERMRPIGFRTGAQNDDLGDSEAWNVWQANSLDADHKLVDSTVLSLSQAYTIVGAMDPDIGAPLITAEVVAQAVDPERRQRPQPCGPRALGAGDEARAQTIRQSCRARLGAASVPRRVIFQPELPMLASGKPDLALLAATLGGGA